MKKTFKSGILIIFIMLPVIAVAHFIAFPQETRCMLIQFADFKKEDNIYFRANTNTDTIKILRQIKSIAERKNAVFWGSNFIADYKIIYCNSEADYKNYGREGSPAATQRKCGVSVVVSCDGLDTSIIAHELAHGILYNNIGWYKTTFKIPVWFDEGLAMQLDDRPYYSSDSVQIKLNAGIKLPDVTKLSKAADFFAGTTDDIMLNFSVAKYTVYEWLKTHSLKIFIERINSGVTFEKAYVTPD